MDKNKVNKIIKKTKKKASLCIAVAMLCAFACIYWLTSPIKYVIGILIILISIIIVVKIQGVSYLLYHECNPQLYYSVAQGILKQVPIDRQIHVAEFIGDYYSAIQLSQKMLRQTKNTYLKIDYMSNIIRNAFYAGDYELCRKSILDFTAVIQSKKGYDLMLKRNEFFAAYMDGNYSQAKELINEIATMPKQQSNAFVCSMLYCSAITDYALNDMPSAKTEFQEIIERYPNMYFAAVSKTFIDGIENDTPVILSKPMLSELPESLAETKVLKKDIIKMVISAVLILTCIIGVPMVMSINAAADTPLEAIKKYEDMEATNVDYTIKLDDKYSVCIFRNKDILGVAYIKAQGTKYQCKMAMYHEDLLIADDAESPSSKMHGVGVTIEIVYRWLYDEGNKPEGYQSVPIQTNGKTVYFCYRLKKPKQYFSNYYGIELHE